MAERLVSIKQQNQSIFQLKENLESRMLYFSVPGLNSVTNCISVSKPEAEVKDTQQALGFSENEMLEFALFSEGRSTSHLNFNYS